MLNESLFMQDYADLQNAKTVIEQDVANAVVSLVGFSDETIANVKSQLLVDKCKTIDTQIAFYEKYIIKEGI